MEIFKDIKGYKGHYQISNFGIIRSLKFGKNIILKSNIPAKGYLQIHLCKNNIVKQYTIHKLIAIHFISNPKNKPCINHKDGNKLNNNIENLEWVTYSENSIHALKNGLMSSPPTWKGKFGYDHCRSIEIHQYCGETLKYLISFASRCETERKMGYGINNLHWAIKHKNKTKDGYYYSKLKMPYFHL